MSATRASYSQAESPPGSDRRQRAVCARIAAIASGEPNRRLLISGPGPQPRRSIRVWIRPRGCSVLHEARPMAALPLLRRLLFLSTHSATQTFTPRQENQFTSRRANSTRHPNRLASHPVSVAPPLAPPPREGAFLCTSAPASLLRDPLHDRTRSARSSSSAP
jgi:hypothetical protein